MYIYIYIYPNEVALISFFQEDPESKPGGCQRHLRELSLRKQHDSRMQT